MSITINSQNLMSVSYRYGPRPYLTPVEHEVFDMQKRGRIEIEIAHALGLSQTEVSCRLEAINRKIKSNESCGNTIAPAHC